MTVVQGLVFVVTVAAPTVLIFVSLLMWLRS